MSRSTILIAICLMACICQIRTNSLTEGLSTFSSDLYKQCVKSYPTANVFISPFSVANSLALLAQGSKGRTYEDLKNGLHLNADKALMSNQFNVTLTSLTGGAGSSTFNVANKVYITNDYRINGYFQNVAREKFHADIENINFGDSMGAANIMNTYIEEKTNHMIKKFITSDMVDADSRLVLINALYFKGNWEHKFDETKTAKGTFHLSKAKTVETDFMYVEDSFNYVYMDELKATALQMKYENSKLSFVIVLPDSDIGLEELESKLENYNLAKITGEMESIEVDLYVPKFKLEFEVSLNNMLKQMKMGSIFSESSELSGLLDTNEALKVNDVIHKAVIECNERGTVAAAASGVHVSLYSLPANFTADHPFFFYIWDESNKMPIFTGRFLNFDGGPRIQPKFTDGTTTPKTPIKKKCAWWRIFCLGLCGCIA